MVYKKNLVTIRLGLWAGHGGVDTPRWRKAGNGVVVVLMLV